MAIRMLLLVLCYFSPTCYFTSYSGLNRRMGTQSCSSFGLSPMIPANDRGNDTVNDSTNACEQANSIFGCGEF